VSKLKPTKAWTKMKPDTSYQISINKNITKWKGLLHASIFPSQKLNGSSWTRRGEMRSRKVIGTKYLTRPPRTVPSSNPHNRSNVAIHSTQPRTLHLSNSPSTFRFLSLPQIFSFFLSLSMRVNAVALPPVKRRD